MPRHAVLLGVMALWLLTLGGCALTDAQVRLDSSAAKLRIRGGREREVIVLPATDTRPDPKRCGAKRNTYGVETADVFCAPAPRQWLGQLVANGLYRAGFRVVTTKTKRAKDPLFVHLELEHLFVDPVPGMWVVTLVADVHVIVKVGTLSGLVAERSFWVKGENAVTAVADDDFQVAVDRATQRLADSIVHAILSLANRYPGLGAVEVAELGPNVTPLNVTALNEVAP
jgi:hypothetical protein